MSKADFALISELQARQPTDLLSQRRASSAGKGPQQRRKPHGAARTPPPRSPSVLAPASHAIHGGRDPPFSSPPPHIWRGWLSPRAVGQVGSPPFVWVQRAGLSPRALTPQHLQVGALGVAAAASAPQPPFGQRKPAPKGALCLFRGMLDLQQPAGKKKNPCDSNVAVLCYGNSSLQQSRALEVTGGNKRAGIELRKVTLLLHGKPSPPEQGTSSPGSQALPLPAFTAFPPLSRHRGDVAQRGARPPHRAQTAPEISGASSARVLLALRQSRAARGPDVPPDQKPEVPPKDVSSPGVPELRGTTKHLHHPAGPSPARAHPARGQRFRARGC